MFALVVLSTLCLLASADDPEPARCCQDRQWEGVLSGVGGRVYPLTGNALPIDSTTLMSYDYYRKKIGLEVHFRNPGNNTETIVRTLLDYGNDLQYISQDGQCTVAKIGEPMQEPCVPSYAKFLGTSQMGYGSEKLAINTWELTKPGTDIIVKRAYTAQGCVPVSESFYGTYNKVSMDLTQVVMNFKPGITNPSFLDTPTSTQGCTFVNEIGPVYGR